MFDFIKYRKIFYIFSAVLVLLSCFAIFAWGLNWGIDFRGGTLWEIMVDNPASTKEAILHYLEKAGVGQVSLQITNDQSLVFRFSSISETKHQQLLTDLRQRYPSLTEVKFENVGPIIGQELTKKMIWAILLVILGILIFLNYSFSQSIHKIPSYRYSILAILCLIHDSLAVIAVFAFLGKLLNWEINSDFLVAVLVVLGYSVHDTIVVYDKIRENLLLFPKAHLSDLINKSIHQTLIRASNTSLTTLFPLWALLSGPSSIKALVLAMIVGIIVGTYSSLFLAAPLLYDWSGSKETI